MDAQDTMRLMFDTMDSYDRADFDRLGEIYAEDARWTNADPNGPHCRNRDDIFSMFRSRMGPVGFGSGGRNARLPDAGRGRKSPLDLLIVRLPSRVSLPLERAHDHLGLAEQITR